jgi:Mg-chelatase subunit ChlI
MISPRLVLGLVAAGVIASAAGGLYLKGRTDAAAKWKPRVEAATRHAELSDAATKSVDRYTREVRVIEKQAREAQDAVRQAPGSDDVFEPAAVLCAQLERLRNEPVCTDDPSPAKLP